MVESFRLAIMALLPFGIDSTDFLTGNYGIHRKSKYLYHLLIEESNCNQKVFYLRVITAVTTTVNLGIIIITSVMVTVSTYTTRVNQVP